MNNAMIVPISKMKATYDWTEMSCTAQTNIPSIANNLKITTFLISTINKEAMLPPSKTIPINPTLLNTRDNTVYKMANTIFAEVDNFSL